MAASCLNEVQSSGLTAHQAPLSMDPPGQNTGVGSHSLLQGIFPTQGSNEVSRFANRFFTS